MTTKKYKALVEQRTRQTLATWARQPSVEEKEIYRFLHNLKGTAGTVGLEQVEELAGRALPYFTDDSHRPWTEAEWGGYLYPLLEWFNDSAAEAPVVPPLTRVPGGRPQYEVLIIEDDVELVAFLRESLEKENYYVSIALSAERGLKLFYENKPDMLLLDIMLPDKSGIDVLQQIVEKSKKEHIPILIISGEHSKELQMHAYSLGVMDYMRKPVDIELLLVLIRNRFELKREWQEAIVIDELTGAFNRKYFNQTLKRLFSDFQRTGRRFTLALFDLDFFKQINDTYGHLVGDEVLQRFAETVKQSIRVEDTFCRYGGEEFALFMPHTDAHAAVQVIERIQGRFAESGFRAKNEAFAVTFSCGLAEVNESLPDADKLIEEADQALYVSKNRGRNRTTVYDERLPGAKEAQPLHVIVVDDDALIREVVTRGFAGWQPAGGKVATVSSYPDGSRFLEADWYTPGEKYVILLDGIMPEMDGLVVLEKLRAGYKTADILVIMLTGRLDQRDIIHALQLGADDYVIKPFNMPELLIRIERLVSRVLY
ncbi:diguanylate cyclase [Paenibacillus tepidiphilus]|uniref:GGDEF domain-containing response regulator n=1 Tax=Paenibacillus tepidiphilus TaxID=2608683 RepID=UPI00123A1393|nr:diguanylate cyclase [Paenibacillus tepidiphilus]